MSRERFLNYQNFGNEAIGPEEAVYLYSLWSVVKAIEKLGFTKFDMNSSFCYAIFSTLVNADEWLVIRL